MVGTATTGGRWREAHEARWEARDGDGRSMTAPGPRTNAPPMRALGISLPIGLPGAWALLGGMLRAPVLLAGLGLSGLFLAAALGSIGLAWPITNPEGAII